MEKPVIVLLLLLLVATVFMIGWIIGEFFTERRYLYANMPALVDEINTSYDLEGTINDSELLLRQKDALIELISHPDLTPLMRESLAVRLIQEEQSHYDFRTRISDTIAKIGPILGLLGTLIPLGPGVIALGQGDTATLSSSLLTAFDTTVMGLICAAVALVVSTIRKSWYSNYMSMLETLMECTLEALKRGDVRNVKAF